MTASTNDWSNLWGGDDDTDNQEITESSCLDGTYSNISTEPDDELDLTKNQKISERFILVNKLGYGGFGQVWEAKDIWLEQMVALKLSRDKMLSEILVLRRLPKERYISVFDYVKDESTGYYGYTMEILGGPWMTLDHFYEKELRPKFDRLDYLSAVKQIIYIAVDLLTSLKHLHGKKHSNKNRWYHADIKPNNLYIHSKDVRKIIKNCWGSMFPSITKIGDLGLSREVGTPMGSGTPGYKAPEQDGFQEFSSKGDIYALGQTLIFLISGRLFNDFSSGNNIHVKKIKTCILEQVPSNLLASKLTRIIREMTYKTAGKRPTAQDLVDQFRKIVASDDDWEVLLLFSDEDTSLTKPYAAKALFYALKKSRGWSNYTASRKIEMRTLIEKAYKTGILKLKGNSYSLR